MEQVARIQMLLLVCCSGLVSAQVLRPLGDIVVEQAGFSNVYEHGDASEPAERYSVLLSTFDPLPFTSDTSYLFKHVGKHLDDLGQVEVVALYDQFTWPREPSQTPLDVFGFETITQPDGFLLPGKNEGTIFVLDVRDWSNIQVHDVVYNASAEIQTDWFYHRVLWKDMDGDARKDAVCCRARNDLEVGFQGQMVWFEHPGTIQGPWKEHVIHENLCDTMSRRATLEADGQAYDVIFTVGYFMTKLVAHWSTHPEGHWGNPDDVQSVVIDEGAKFFDLELTDLNTDGTMDMLVTHNAEVNGSLWVYEIPDDFREPPYEKHLLRDGFNATSGMGGAGAPGQAQTFYPNNQTSGKPWILLSGDDDGAAYYLIPESQDPQNWSYQMVRFLDEGEGNIVGRPSAVDVNGDGHVELFVPSFFQDVMRVYTFSP